MPGTFFCHLLNRMVGSTPIKLRFGDIPLKQLISKMNGPDYYHVGPKVEFHFQASEKVHLLYTQQRIRIHLLNSGLNLVPEPVRPYAVYLAMPLAHAEEKLVQEGKQ